jgi:trehalose 6-phosphate phosphatase
MEIDGGGAHFLHEGLREGAPVISELRGLTQQVLSGLAGIVVEDKAYSFVLHTRLAALSVKATATRALCAVIAPFEQRGAVRLQQGHEMSEVLPNVAWNKGDAVHWIERRVAEHARGAVRTTYVGDDLTDEDAFRAVGPGGVTVVVGTRPSAARFRLADPSAVEALVRMLATMPAR